MRQVAKELRQRQQKHIQAQQNPDGSAFIPRKKKRRDKPSQPTTFKKRDEQYICSLPTIKQPVYKRRF